MNEKNAKKPSGRIVKNYSIDQIIFGYCYHVAGR